MEWHRGRLEHLLWKLFQMVDSLKWYYPYAQRGERSDQKDRVYSLKGILTFLLLRGQYFLVSKLFQGAQALEHKSVFVGHRAIELWTFSDYVFYGLINNWVFVLILFFLHKNTLLFINPLFICPLLLNWIYLYRNPLMYIHLFIYTYLMRSLLYFLHFTVVFIWCNSHRFQYVMHYLLVSSVASYCYYHWPPL